ncbi:MAG: acyl-CoA dehydrogenase C-terminal domain-containing protein [Gammaproteobacteria bacterium]
MTVYKAPLRDMQFVLHEVFSAGERWASMEATRELTPDLADAILGESAKLAENVLFPLNRNSDEEGCRRETGADGYATVATPKGFRDAFRQLAEGGWTALSGAPEYGGQGMPKMLTVMFDEMLYGANSSFALYPMLSNGCTLCIASHGSDEQKQVYLPPIYEGRWCGTMCLTESHSGTDLGIIRTKAVPNADGSFAVSGTKIFITGGEHDLVDNIIHLVLAKLPDAPPGPKGISLFIVPKFLVNADGSLGARNPVNCGSIEHKMGIKGSATAVLNFDGAQGWLIGEPGNGLAYMFTMMNYERLSIGIQGLGLGEVAYQSALAYARDRLQGRAATGAVAKDKPADPITVHPDVRRMLLTARAHTEAGRAFACFVGEQLDMAKFHGDAAVRERADALVQLLTPVAKACFSDRGFEACVLGQQVFGGHGYIREWGMEQLVRDARIAQIYEGTNGIQALDLAGRKVARNGGAYMKVFLDEMRRTLADANGVAAVAMEAQATARVMAMLEELTQWLVAEAKNDANAVGAASVDYLELTGLVTYSWLWLRMMAIAAPKTDDPFHAAKLATGRFWFQRILPRADALAAQIRAGSATLMDPATQL